MSNNTVIDGIKLIDTGNTVIDAANLDLAVLEKDGEDDWCTMLYMKNNYCVPMKFLIFQVIVQKLETQDGNLNIIFKNQSTKCVKLIMN